MSGAPVPGLELRTGCETDWPAVERLTATCFGAFRPPEVNAMWQTMTPDDGLIIALDGPDVVGTVHFLELHLTVPGAAVLPTAGVTWVAVAPTHRRRGVLRAMFDELHRRLQRFPIAGLFASETSIYGRFGYGPATVEHRLRIDRRGAEFDPRVPDPGGVRSVDPAAHRNQLEDVYERWRLAVPGGLLTPAAMWDEVLADREAARHGGSPFFALVHPDGFAMYRIHDAPTGKTADVTKFIALTPDARIGLWRALMGLDLMDHITLSAPPGIDLPLLLTDSRRVRTHDVEDGLWLRLIDVPAALRARTYAADLVAVVEVLDDDLGPGGRFALDVRDGTARCATTTDAPDVRLGRAELSSIYLGAHRATSYLAAHRLDGSRALVEDFDRAFATDVPAEVGFGF